MANSIARISGTALVPGVSKNGRLYSADAIGKAVERATQRIAEGAAPLTVKTHHGAEDDSTRIVGRLTKVWQDEDGRAHYNGELADTEHARTIAKLIDPGGGDPFLAGVSIRGAWAAPQRTVTHEGKQVHTADDLELDGLDFTHKPGVPGAGVEDFAWTSKPRESATGRVLIYESVPEVRVDSVEEAATVESSTQATEEFQTVGSATVEEKGAPALKSGKPAAAPTPGASVYADPGYQDDKAKRYPLDTKAHAKSAWSYVNMPKNAKMYTPNQLKRVKARIVKALTKFGVKVETDKDTKEQWLIATGALTETALAEFAGFDSSRDGSFCVNLTNGPVCVSVSSYCVDPADLEVIGTAAMKGAVTALKGLDPDMDGDIDVEDPDDASGSKRDDNSMESQASADVAVEKTAETTADPTENQEANVVSDAAPKAVESVDAANTDGDVLTALSAKLDNLPAAIAAALAAAPAAVAAESTPDGGKVEATESAPATVTETDDERINRLVREGVAAALPNAIAEHVETNGATRKGLVKPPVTETATEHTPEFPEGWPVNAQTGIHKQPHEMSRDEFNSVAGPVLFQYVTGKAA